MIETPTTFDIGSMRDRVRIQRDVGKQSASGAIEQDWQDFAFVWAAIDSQNGSELFSGQEIYPESRTIITIRYLPNISESMRVLWLNPRTKQDVQFDIKNITDVNNRHFIMQLTCTQRPIERNA